ncbi:GntR family transcriptional regulator, partial [Burkholderia gladioli]
MFRNETAQQGPGMSIQPIQNRRLYQQIADKLGALIEAGDFPP